MRRTNTRQTTRYGFVLASLVAVAVAAMPGKAAAQQKNCPVGKDSAGNCVNAALSQSLQRRTIVVTQPGISFAGIPAQGASGGGNLNDTRQQSLGDQLYGASGPPAGTFIPLPSNVNPATLHLSLPYSVVPGGIRLR
jgi:hypothetical protein